MKGKSSVPEEQLYKRVAEILERARGQVARSVNTAMVQAYWHLGREIVEVEQAGAHRAAYGQGVLVRLAARLQGPFGKGFSVQNLGYMRQFYLAFPVGSALNGIPQTVPGELQKKAGHATSPSRSIKTTKRHIRRGAGSVADSGTLAIAQMFPAALGWTHYIMLMRIANPIARAFYEIEAAREAWSTRQLERQIGSLLFERLAKHRDPQEVLALARRGLEVARPEDVIKDPFVLEFLDLGEPAALRERDVEQAIIDRLESFLLEMGKGFCFVGRQKRLTIDGDHFYVDLVFYNRLLRCFVLVDLKLGKLSHQDLGQMLMYVNYYDRAQRVEHENKTIGIVLCSKQNSAMAKITLPENDQIIAATYRDCLPTEAELAAELERERAKVELLLRLTATSRDDPGK